MDGDSKTESSPKETKRSGGGNSSPPGLARDEVRTLFVSGFPSDVKEREIHNLFRFFPGYEGCVLVNENVGKQPVAFVSFFDRQSALRALRVIQDMKFDPNLPQTLRIEFAKSNSKTKRLANEYADKRRRIGSPTTTRASGGAGFYQSTFDQQYNSNYGVNPMLIPWFQNMNIREPPGLNTSVLSQDPTLATLSSHLTNTFAGPSLSAVPVAAAPVPPNANFNSKLPPCSTLFIANLHSDVMERDLVRLFRITPGFRRLRLSSKENTPICFVEYTDVASSTHALNLLQGMLVGQSQIRIEYARSRMGETKRRDRDSANEEDDQDDREKHQNKKQNKNNRNYSENNPQQTLHPQSHNSILNLETENEGESLGATPAGKHHYSQ